MQVIISPLLSRILRGWVTHRVSWCRARWWLFLLFSRQLSLSFCLLSSYGCVGNGLTQVIRQFYVWFSMLFCQHATHTRTRLMALCLGPPGWASTRKVKPIWIILKQETLSGSGISWAICKSTPRSRQITMPPTHHSVFYRPDALPAAQPTASKHWRQSV